MAYQIIWTAPAEVQLRKLDRSVARRIYQKVGSLSVDPFRLVRRLVGAPIYRLRVGDYRVLLDIQSGVVRILVLHVGPRSTVYDR